MPKKRRKSRKTHRSRPVSAKASVPALQLLLDHVDEDGEEDEDIREDFFRAYPTVQDAVAAMKGGKHVEWWGNVDGGPMRHVLLDAPDGPVVEQAVFPGIVLADAVRCALLQSDDLNQTDAGILAVLDELHELVRPVLEADIRSRRPQYAARKASAFVDTDARGQRRFGWRIHHPVSTVHDWHDTWEPALWNMSVEFDHVSPLSDRVPESQPEAIYARFQRHSVPVVLCKDCKLPITNRHHRWPGVWVTPLIDVSAVCETPGGQRADLWPEEDHRDPDDRDFGFPHQPQLTDQKSP